MNNYIQLADVIFEIASELNITSLRKDFWDLKVEITNAVRNKEIQGTIGREVNIDPVSLKTYIDTKKVRENITTPNTVTLKSLKQLIESMDKLTAEEQLSIIKNRLKNI